jgi:flavin reductase (DIM6/NTAB) family NADH-FMN oxidoreductase RutF
MEEDNGTCLEIPSEKHIFHADYFGMASGENTDKFAASDLTPVRNALVNAPCIEVFPAEKIREKGA